MENDAPIDNDTKNDSDNYMEHVQVADIIEKYPQSPSIKV